MTSWKESGLPTATSSCEARFFSHPGSINAHLSLNSSVANFAREITVFNVGKTPRRIFLASMPREMPVVACSSLWRQLPKACRQRSPSIVRYWKLMLQVTRYVTTSPGNLRLRIALRPVIRPLIKREWRADWVLAIGVQSFQPVGHQ